MLILAVAVALVALYFFYTAAQALLGPPLPARGLGEDAGMGLIIKRDFLIEELRDLELEAALDKLSEADLAQLKARYEVEAISIIEALEAREGAYAARIEADLKRRVEALGEGGAGQPQQPEQIKAQQPKP
ncbi:hypothetical protein KKF91_13675, partial [Myxococcota bacterium]|nr:hypothetical protein [Myxococcota bacterium]